MSICNCLATVAILISVSGTCIGAIVREDAVPLNAAVTAIFPEDPWKTDYQALFADVLAHGLSAHPKEEVLFRKRFHEHLRPLLEMFALDVRMAKEKKIVIDPERRARNMAIVADNLKRNVESPLLDDEGLAREKELVARYSEQCLGHIVATMERAEFIALQGFAMEDLRELSTTRPMQENTLLGSTLLSKADQLRATWADKQRAASIAVYALAQIRMFGEIYTAEQLERLGNPFYSRTPIGAEAELHKKLVVAEELIDKQLVSGHFIVDKSATNALLVVLFIKNPRMPVNGNDFVLVAQRPQLLVENPLRHAATSQPYSRKAPATSPSKSP